jgi:poly(3-hydroxybutyrate) depolymerase
MSAWRASAFHDHCVRATAVIVLLACGVADAVPKPPCARCTLDVPAKAEGDRPLLVVLHGDREHAPAAAARWRAAAKAKDWVLLSLECPKSEGCTDSWWQWAGDPAWITAQIAAVQKLTAIDAARIYLAGWSGGASYIGMIGSAWPSLIAGVVIHGGGMAPSAKDCPVKPLPAYFLVGDANPLHRLARDLRGWFESCKEDVEWDLVKRGDHAREERALTKAKAIAILNWLAAHPRA